VFGGLGEMRADPGPVQRLDHIPPSRARLHRERRVEAVELGETLA
jgi:hypothetical protein